MSADYLVSKAGQSPLFSLPRFSMNISCRSAERKNSLCHAYERRDWAILFQKINGNFWMMEIIRVRCYLTKQVNLGCPRRLPKFLLASGKGGSARGSRPSRCIRLTNLVPSADEATESKPTFAGALVCIQPKSCANSGLENTVKATSATEAVFITGGVEWTVTASGERVAFHCQPVLVIHRHLPWLV